MSKKDQHIEEFVLMRIEGISYSEISSRLNVSKQSLINWSKDLSIKDCIDRGRYIRREALIKALEEDTDGRIKRWAQLSRNLYSELKDRDLSTLPTDKLVTLIVKAEERLNKLTPSYILTDDIDPIETWGEQRELFFSPID